MCINHFYTAGQYSRDAGDIIMQRIERKIKVSMACRVYVVLKVTA